LGGNFKERIFWFSDKIVKLARENSKISGLWVQAVSIPAGREDDVYNSVIWAASRGIEVIAAWSYKDYSFLNLSDNPELVWEKLTKAFKRVLEKNHTLS